MAYDSKTLWIDFKRSLVRNLNNSGIEALDKVWKPNSDWTSYLMDDLFPKVSTDLQLSYKNEYKKVDAILYVQYKFDQYNYSIDVPIICIESENNHDDISFSELINLCFLNAPLKIIITHFDKWDKGIMEDYTSDEWRAVIGSFKNANRLVGWLGFIIVVEDENNFIFYSFVYDENGNLHDENELTRLTYSDDNS